MLLADRYAELRASARVHERALFPAAAHPERTGTASALVCRRLRQAISFRLGRGRRDRPIWHLEPRRRPGFLRRRRPAELPATRSAAPSSSTWRIAVGKHTATPPTRPSTTRSCTSSCSKATATFFTRTRSNRNVPQVRVDPEHPAGLVLRQRPAGATGPLPGAAERFAGRAAPLHSRRRLAIPTATQSRAAQEHRRKSRAR